MVCLYCLSVLYVCIALLTECRAAVRQVGEYDSDEGELWDNHDSADSTESQWETQSEESMVAGDEP